MRLYIYAIASGLAESNGLTGVAGEPLVVVPARDMVAVCGWIARTPGVNRETLTVQDRIVRTLHARAEALLPMRFGTNVADETELERKLDSLEPGLRESLTQVKGREQMTLRVLAGGSSAAGAAGASGAAGAGGAGGAAPRVSVPATRDDHGIGKSYLESRRAAAIPPEIQRLIDGLRSLQRATRIERGRVERLIATIYSLIERGSSDAYRAAVRQAAASVPSVTVRVTGPGPAYAFANLAPTLVSLTVRDRD